VRAGKVIGGSQDDVRQCAPFQDGHGSMVPPRSGPSVGSATGERAEEEPAIEAISLITPPDSPAPDDAVAGPTPPAVAQPSIPPPRPLTAAVVARPPPRDPAPLLPINLPSHASDEDPSYDPYPSRGRRRSSRGDRARVAVADPECNFSPGFSRTGGVLPSDLLGPFEGRSMLGRGNKRLWVHEVCALWAPEVYRDPDTKAMVGIHKAYVRGQRLRCSECSRFGATVGCYVPSCDEVFHYLCVMAGGCPLVEEPHVILCERHKDQAASPEIIAMMGSIAAAAAAAVTRSEAVTAASAGDPDAAKDAPHSEVTGLRRGETEAIVCRDARISSCPPTGKAVTVALRTGRVLGPGERLILGDRPMRVPANALASVLARMPAAVKAPASIGSSIKKVGNDVQASPCRSPFMLVRNLKQTHAFQRGELRPSVHVVPPSYTNTVAAPSSPPTSPRTARPVGKGKALAVPGGPGWCSATGGGGGGGGVARYEPCAIWRSCWGRGWSHVWRAVAT